MKNIWIKLVVCTVLMFLGICIIIYPFVLQHINAEHNDDLITQYKASVTSQTTDQQKERQTKIDAYNQKIADDVLFSYDGWFYENEMIGIVEIPLLKCTLPLLCGTSDKVLDVGAGHIEGTSIPAEGSNIHAVISAHSGHPSLYAFDKIDTLKQGDMIYVTSNEKRYEYRVIDSITVLPEQSDIHLNIEKDKNLLTLMTCTPYGINSHRMLVKAEFNGCVDVLYDSESRKTNLLIILICGLIIVMASFTIFIGRRVIQNAKTQQK